VRRTRRYHPKNVIDQGCIHSDKAEGKALQRQPEIEEKHRNPEQKASGSGEGAGQAEEVTAEIAGNTAEEARAADAASQTDTDVEVSEEPTIQPPPTEVPSPTESPAEKEEFSEAAGFKKALDRL